MAVLATAVALAIVLTVVNVFRTKYRSQKIPSTAFGWPVVGNAMLFGQDPISFLRTATAMYGRIFQVPMIFTNTVWLRGNDMNKLYLDTKEDTWSFGDGMGLFLKKIVSEGYFTHLRTFVGSVNRGINRSQNLAHFSELITQLAEETASQWATKPEIDLFEHTSSLVHRIIVRCLMGPDFYEHHVDELFELLHAMEADIGSAWNFLLPEWVPHPPARRLKAARERMWAIFEERLKERQEHPERWEGALDYVSYTLQDPVTAHLSGYYAAHHTLLVFAAHTSTVASIAWTLLELLKSPERLAAVRAELRDHKNPEDAPLLAACLKESSRHFSGVSMLRLARKPVDVAGTTVKPGAVVSISPYLTHHDPASFASPDEWLPERWLQQPDLPKRLNAGGRAGFLPFGGGSHRCPGEKFAVIIAARVIAEIVGQYEVGWGLSQKGRSTDEMDFSKIGSAWLKGDAFVSVSKREKEEFV